MFWQDWAGISVGKLWSCHPQPYTSVYGRQPMHEQMNSEFKRRADRIAYLVAVEKFDGFAEEARVLAREVLNYWGREVCPITGQQFFWVCCEQGGSDAEEWTTPQGLGR